jgi:hypothetical protein
MEENFSSFLAKPRQKGESILKTYGLFIYEDIYYITNFVKCDRNRDNLA